MVSSSIRRALWKAAEDVDFRRRSLSNLGLALAEEGIILTDAEMTTMRNLWEPLRGLSERAAYERITALARFHPR
jgi:hypothetical protein